jgi:hypothetical protein
MHVFLIGYMYLRRKDTFKLCQWITSVKMQFEIFFIMIWKHFYYILLKLLTTSVTSGTTVSITSKNNYFSGKTLLISVFNSFTSWKDFRFMTMTIILVEYSNISRDVYVFLLPETVNDITEQLVPYPQIQVHV